MELAVGQNPCIVWVCELIDGEEVETVSMDRLSGRLL